MSKEGDLKSLIRIRQRYLQKLREQEASFGLHTPPHIKTEIEDVEAELERLYAELASLKRLVEREGRFHADTPNPAPATAEHEQAPGEPAEELLSVRKVFSAPFHYGVAAIKIGLVHPTLMDQISQKVKSNPAGEMQSFEIKWEEDYEFEKDLFGPFIVRNPVNDRYIIIYLTSTRPEYSKSLRKDSISLSFRDREYLEVDRSVDAIEIVPTPDLARQRVKLAPAPEDYRTTWARYGADDDEEEEEE